MNISKECYLCIFNQVYKITDKLKLDEQTSSEVIRLGARILSKYDLNHKPPIIASDIYKNISFTLKIPDLFKQEKQKSIQEALKFKKILQKRLKKSKNPLFEAAKIAIAGNVIDFGVNHEFNLEKEIKKIFKIKFARNDFEQFKEKLKSSKTICYLADNAGENVFDEIFIKQIKKEFDVKVYYLVRGAPIINDVTLDDLENSEIFELAKVVSSGVDTPGFCLERADKLALDIFYGSDLVISKGMGNFECLYEECNREVFYFFKVKCEVVARKAKAKLGDYMLLRGEE